MAPAPATPVSAKIIVIFLYPIIDFDLKAIA